MLKKLRRRLVLSAVAAVSAVLLLLICGINVWNFIVTTGRMDNTLSTFAQHNGEAPPDIRDDSDRAAPPEQTGQSDQKKTPENRAGRFFGEPSPEMKYMMRYFSVSFTDGEITSTLTDFVGSITTEQAQEYAQQIYSSGREHGFCGEYRFLMTGDGSDTLVVFLNVSPELSYMRTLLLVSSAVGVICLAAAAVLIAVFSRRAIAPYVRNIEQQKRFITAAGHELKTPITAISASADVLDMEIPGNEWVQNIQKQAVRLSCLTAELVELSRLSEEQPFPERAEFSLSDAAWEIAEAFSFSARAAGKRFTSEIEDNVTVYGSMSAFQKLTSILLDNALKYSDENAEIRLAVKRRGRRAEITVFNTCEHIDRAEIPHFFERFYRSDKSRSSPGNGLGLAAAREIAEAHGGRLTAKTSNERDITFRVIV